MSTAPAFVSVLMPAFNAERTVAEAAESVLRQDHGAFDLVVVDDASDDRTPRILADLTAEDDRLRVFRNPAHLGGPRSRNRAFDERSPRARYVAVMDADDVCAEDRLSRQVAYLEEHPDVAVVGSHIRFIDEASRVLGERRYPLSPTDVAARLFVENPFAHPATMLRVDALARVGGYDATRQRLDDYELWMRLLAEHRGANLDCTLLDYRVSATQSKSRNTKAILRHTLLLKATRMGLREATNPRVLARLVGELGLCFLPAPAIVRLFRHRHGLP